MALDERVLEDVRSCYQKLESEDSLLSENQLNAYYDNFRGRFGPEQLAALDGEQLVETIHSHANKDSLVYWLEFKKDAEFDTTRLGSIRGGSALKFGVYRDANTGAWMSKGPKGAPAEISLEQAIEAAERYRDQLIRGAELLENLPAGASDEDYRELQEKMDLEAPEVSGLSWGHKYFSLLYPDKLDDYHNPHYQRFHLVKLLQVPPTGNGRYAAAGRYVSAARELALPLANLTQVLNYRDGEPHRYWRVLVNYANLGPEWTNWPTMRDEGFVAIGWKELGDLSTITPDRAGKGELQSLMQGHYSDKGRWTKEIHDFATQIQPGDLVLAFEGSTILGVGRIIGPYGYVSDSRMPHRRAVEWLSENDWELPQQEASHNTIRELKNFENLAKTEDQILGAVSENYKGRRAPMPENASLNKILYGPPGTGKTYSVQSRSLEILEPGLLMEKLDPKEVAKRFRDYLSQGRVEFVTFHPSYSYEEFVEGYRYDEESKVPTLHKGVFRSIAERAIASHQPPLQTDTPRIWKVSLGGSDAPDIFERSIQNNEIAIGWFEEDLSGATREDLTKLFARDYGNQATNSLNSVDYFTNVDHVTNGMKDGDYVAVLKNRREIRAIGVVNGPYRYKGKQYGYHYPHTRPVDWLDQNDHDIYELNGAKYLTLSTVYPLDRIPLQEFMDLLPERERSEEPHVLVIDEINRGNISRIFGELITLLEVDKRRGAENELSVRLPYSGQPFTVPKNLHLIGTMNSADRSIALLDVALRRRFEFEEMMPDSDVIRRVLNGKLGSIHPELNAEFIEFVCGVFEVLNRRVTVMLDRDHQIGHSYFLAATSPEELRRILYNQVLPLLQEYFYDDAERLRRILGRHDPGEGSGFVTVREEYRSVFNGEFSLEELPWEFHTYSVEELVPALRRTFLS